MTSAHVVYPPPEVWNYGIPFSWRDVIFVAGPTGPIVETDWNWFAFALDALFYMAIGDLVVTTYRRGPRHLVKLGPDVVLSVTYVVFVLGISIGGYLMFCGVRTCV